MKRVVIGMSGGVDSSVAAHILKEQGYEVIALFMKNWHDVTGVLSGDCEWHDDVMFAEMAAKKLEIPFHTVDLSEKYRQRVVDYMFSEYEKGRTPNPDVLCNREIKFDEFAKAAMELGADYVATGHYCRKDEYEKDGKTYYQLLAGVDGNKDQSYFLCQVSQEQLKTALFPIGHLTKPEVRKIAEELDLVTAQRKDSQGICFVGKVDLPTFLQQKLTAKEGNIIEIPEKFYKEGYHNEDTHSYGEGEMYKYSRPVRYKPFFGKVVGKHNGAQFYTIGQRKGLGVGGTKEPLFVIAIDVEKNIVYTGQGQNHSGLFRRALFIDNDEVHWTNPDFKIEIGEKKEFSLRIRYRQPLQKGYIYRSKDGIYMVFDKLQRGVTAGQFASWYHEDELVGSGVISI